jgi:4-hydroxybenzoate polyprenyltransferase
MNSSRLLPWLQLIRAPNLLTVAADLLTGYWITLGPVLALGPDSRFRYFQMISMLLAGLAFYVSGTVLNDRFDLEKDRRERPLRPLPSGRITPAAASRLGWGAMLVAIGATFALSVLPLFHNSSSFSVATSKDSLGGLILIIGIGLALGASILGYDGPLKKTPFGPPMMGMCRFWNMALGMAAALAYHAHVFGRFDFRFAPWEAAIGAMLYITGITWFAGKETRTNRRSPLLLAAMLAMFGLLFPMLYQIIHLLMAEFLNPRLLILSILKWMLALLIPFLYAGVAFTMGIHEPRPERLQKSVGMALQNLLLFDAGLCMYYSEVDLAMFLVFLMLPLLLLKRAIPMT